MVCLHKLMGVELKMSSAYHPETDGSTERANRTSIEFAINSARSESTGYAPFFLNTGRMPRIMIWDNPTVDEYPGVRAYAQKMKYAIMSAHDSIIAARVKQTRDANRRRRPAPFAEDDLVYVSTKNMSRILRDFRNSSYTVALPSSLKRRGIHDVFHASLLQVHEPNDDRLFPGRLDNQVAELEDQDGEWAIDRIASHRGTRDEAIFEAVWKSGDRTLRLWEWPVLPTYPQVRVRLLPTLNFS